MVYRNIPKFNQRPKQGIVSPVSYSHLKLQGKHRVQLFNLAGMVQFLPFPQRKLTALSIISIH